MDGNCYSMWSSGGAARRSDVNSCRGAKSNQERKQSQLRKKAVDWTHQQANPITPLIADEGLYIHSSVTSSDALLLDRQTDRQWQRNVRCSVPSQQQSQGQKPPAPHSHN